MGRMGGRERGERHGTIGSSAAAWLRPGCGPEWPWLEGWRTTASLLREVGEIVPGKAQRRGRGAKKQDRRA